MCGVADLLLITFVLEGLLQHLQLGSYLHKPHKVCKLFVRVLLFQMTRLREQCTASCASRNARRDNSFAREKHSRSHNVVCCSIKDGRDRTVKLHDSEHRTVQTFEATVMQLHHFTSSLLARWRVAPLHTHPKSLHWLGQCVLLFCNSWSHKNTPLRLQSCLGLPGNISTPQVQASSRTKPSRTRAR